jgi:hypothetical protein
MRTINQILALVVLLLGGYYVWQYLNTFNPVEQLAQNYETEIESICKEMQLPAEYFKALVILESSAKKPAQTRYEAHVYERLKDVRNGKSERYGRFTSKQLQILSEQTLTKMATSYGPLQIMGYHCIPLGITIDELSGENAIRYAIIWADKNYGEYLKRGDYVNCFHIHNTGQPMPSNGIPKTHKPDYIKRGLEYIKLFKDKKRRQREEEEKKE